MIDHADGFNEKLQEWETFYNFHCPHGASPNEQTEAILRLLTGFLSHRSL